MRATGFLVDIDGVILRDDAPLPGAAELVRWLLESGSRFLFLTNYPSQTPADLADLFDGASTLLAQVDVWRRVQSKVADPTIWADCIQGAELLAYARLAKIGVCRALDDDDLAIKRAALDLIAPRGHDPDHMRAAIEWAVELGRTVTDRD